MKRYFDVGVIIPLEEELLQFQDVFDCFENLSLPTSFRHTFNTGAKGLSGIVVQQEDMGKTNALRSTQQLLEDYDIGLLVCLGIAGSLSDDMTIGDVCYSDRVIDVYDNSKYTEKKKGKIDIEFSPNFYITEQRIVSAINFSRTLPELKHDYSRWQQRQLSLAKKLIPGTYTSKNGKRTVEAPQTKPGKIVCASVSKSPGYNEAILKLERKLLAIETESGGVFEAAHRVPALAIRGISDFADMDKGKLEAETKGKARSLAASNASSFLSAQLQNPYFQKVLHEIRDANLNSTDWRTLKAQPSGKNIPTLVDAVRQKIDSSLRDLSQEYRLQKQGYVLPTPRLKFRSCASSINSKRLRNQLFDFRELVNSQDRIVVETARNYPDKGLPWVLANDLITSQKCDKQIIPIVIDSNELRPPEHGLDWYKRKYFPKFQSCLSDVHIVFLISGIQGLSATKSDYIFGEIIAATDSTVVLILQEAQDKIATASKIDELGAVSCELCSVSFAEMARFLEKNFQMPSNESEVVANRLHSVFRQFELSAHPSYFAGIPLEVLSSLLHANRRAELISLAVVGFLSFVVAGDRSTVALSRTTREIFLRNLVFLMRVEKQSYSQADLVQFTQDFAAKNDFDIDPLTFLNAFVDKGILHFDQAGKVAFSLQFMESFLLARELVDNSSAAIGYFNVDSDEFDSECFDLYSEMGPSPALVEGLIRSIERSRDELQVYKPDKDILFGAKVRTDFLFNSGFLEGVEQRILSLAEKLKGNHSNTQEKQRILDISERVSSRARDRRLEIEEEKKREIDLGGTQLSHAIATFIAVTTLLGSGAERLDADTKRKLATELVHLGVDLTCIITEVHNSVDFNSMRKELVAEPFLQDLLGVPRTDSEKEQQKRIIDDLVTMLHFHFLASPFASFLGHLIEHSRNVVLASSIRKTQFDGGLASLVGALWLADIDSRGGKDALTKVLKSIQTPVFLGITICQHLIHRVYWHQWRQEDRTALLEVVQDLTKAMKAKVDIQQIEKELSDISLKAKETQT